MQQTILIVEDDQDICLTMEAILKIEGYKTHTAGNGKECLELLRKIKVPDLILLDLIMPVMNGLEFLQVRQKDYKIASIPVIVLSGFSDEKIKGLGVGFLKKPFTIDALLTEVRRLMDKDQITRPGR